MTGTYVISTSVSLMIGKSFQASTNANSLMTARHEILGGRVHVYKRDGRFWQCSASVGGKQYRATTKKEELPQAEDFAEDWYLELRGKFKRGDLGQLEEADAENKFADAAEQF